MSPPETIEVEPPREANGSVIWLHGLGADGHDFEPIVPALRLPPALALRFVFPHAPVKLVTINDGVSMRAWYDVVSLDRDGPQDEVGIRESARLLEDLVARERERGVLPERIVLAGFSQGGAIALHTALRYPDPLAGLMALSTWLPLQQALAVEAFNNENAQTKKLSIFMAHGTFDPLLPLALGQQSRQVLESAGYSVEWHEYPMAHEVSAEEVSAIRDWLVSVYDHHGRQ